MPNHALISAELSERIAALIGERDELTMYALANVWSELRGERVREQMLYNYRAKRLIRCNGAGRVDRDEAIAFLAKKLAK